MSDKHVGLSLELLWDSVSAGVLLLLVVDLVAVQLDSVLSGTEASGTDKTEDSSGGESE